MREEEKRGIEKKKKEMERDGKRGKKASKGIGKKRKNGKKMKIERGHERREF